MVMKMLRGVSRYLESLGSIDVALSIHLNDAVIVRSLNITRRPLPIKRLIDSILSKNDGVTAWFFIR